MKEVVLVPEERIGTLKDGDTKEKLEKELNVKIVFEDNSVEIEGEGLDLYKTKLIVKAVGRGFSPANAFRLLNDEEQLEIAKEAVNMILYGAKLTNVYGFLHKADLHGK